MTKFMALGMPLDQIIERTTLAPAQALRRPDLGTLKPGMPADASVLQIQNGSYSLEDCVGEKLLARQKLIAKGTVVEGRWQPSESYATTGIAGAGGGLAKMGGDPLTQAA